MEGKREKKRSKETRFKPPTFKCRRCAFPVFGPNVVRLPQPQPAVEHPPLPQRRAHASPLLPYLVTIRVLVPSRRWFNRAAHALTRSRAHERTRRACPAQVFRPL